jgi:hypothetical protein
MTAKLVASTNEYSRSSRSPEPSQRFLLEVLAHKFDPQPESPRHPVEERDRRAVTVPTVQKCPRFPPNVIGRHEQRIRTARKSTCFVVVRVALSCGCDPVRHVDEDHRERFGP